MNVYIFMLMAISPFVIEPALFQTPALRAVFRAASA
jgi:hypothetical protein